MDGRGGEEGKPEYNSLGCWGMSRDDCWYNEVNLSSRKVAAVHIECTLNRHCIPDTETEVLRRSRKKQSLEPASFSPS